MWVQRIGEDSWLIDKVKEEGCINVFVSERQLLMWKYEEKTDTKAPIICVMLIQVSETLMKMQHGRAYAPSFSGSLRHRSSLSSQSKSQVQPDSQ